MNTWVYPFAIACLAVGALMLVAAAGYGVGVTIARHRRDRLAVARQVNLAAGIREERDDLMDVADVVLDPPVVRAYVTGMVPYGNTTVHERCRDARRDGRPGEICGRCAMEFVRAVIA